MLHEFAPATNVTSAGLEPFHSNGTRRPSEILLVNAKPLLLNRLASRLARRGARVTATAHYLEALARLRQDPPVDVVIADVRLEDFNGLQLANRLRDSAVPVIITHPVFDAIVSNEAHALGAHFIADPERNLAFDELVSVWTSRPAAGFD